MPSITRRENVDGTNLGYWAFWLQLAGMFGMTLSFGTAGIGQVYLERILGMGYLDTQLKIQVHFLMLVATASLFTVGVMLFIVDFFRYAPRFEASDDHQLFMAGLEDYLSGEPTGQHVAGAAFTIGPWDGSSGK